MNYQTVLSEATRILKGKLIKNPKLDSEILLSNTLNIEREKLLIKLNQEINNEDLKNFNNLIKRTKKKEPIAYIIGYKEFWKKKFKVNNNVLIPRPDTEHIVEEVLKFIPNNLSMNILDIGTGSGCIILSILCERNKCYGVALDISKKALNVAKYNAKIQHIKNRIKFVNSDIDKFKLGTYDVIVSNPPYIKNYEIDYLEEDIKFFEPKIALNGGIDGYSKIKSIINRCTILIKKNGKLFLEVGNDQMNQTTRILNNKGFIINKIVKDLAKNNRCIISTKI